TQVHRSRLTAFRTRNNVAVLFGFSLECALRISLEVTVLIASHSVKSDNQRERFRLVVVGWNVNLIRLQRIINFRYVGLFELSSPSCEWIVACRERIQQRVDFFECFTKIQSIKVYFAGASQFE